MPLVMAFETTVTLKERSKHKRNDIILSQNNASSTHYAKTVPDWILTAAASKRPLLKLFYYKLPDLRSVTVPWVVYFLPNPERSLTNYIWKNVSN
jgi:hypothetical protein